MQDSYRLMMISYSQSHDKCKIIICVAKTKALISRAVTGQLICDFVFAYAALGSDCPGSWSLLTCCFSHYATRFVYN